MFKPIKLTHLLFVLFLALGIIITVFIFIYLSYNDNKYSSKINIQNKINDFNNNKPFLCDENHIVRKSNGFDLFYKNINNYDILFVKNDRVSYKFLWCKPFNDSDFVKLYKEK